MGEIKQFVSQVMPSFNNVEWRQSFQQMPFLVIYDKNSTAIERINLINKTSEECTSILLERGFRKTSYKDNSAKFAFNRIANIVSIKFISFQRFITKLAKKTYLTIA